jgi:hypothetical protein
MGERKHINSEEGTNKNKDEEKYTKKVIIKYFYY